jgi:cytochrome c-type biogenesis protein CcmF
VLAWLGVALAAWAMLSAVTEFAERIGLFRMPFSHSVNRAARLPRSAWGVMLGHAGLGLTVAGITASTAWQTEAIRVMRPGDGVEIAGHSVRLDRLDQLRVENYEAERATFTVMRNGTAIAQLYPEKRFYPVARMPTTEAAIRNDGASDLYIALGDPDGNGGWTVRVYHHPLVAFIWYGAVVMAFGGLLSLTDRRLRVGAPMRARQLQRAALPAE